MDSHINNSNEINIRILNLSQGLRMMGGLPSHNTNIKCKIPCQIKNEFLTKNISHVSMHFSF